MKETTFYPVLLTSPLILAIEIDKGKAENDLKDVPKISFAWEALRSL